MIILPTRTGFFIVKSYRKFMEIPYNKRGNGWFSISEDEWVHDDGHVEKTPFFGWIIFPGLFILSSVVGRILGEIVWHS